MSVFRPRYSNSSDCGYCRRTRSGQSRKRYSYYATTSSLSPKFYQKLVDRCWRRSGTLLYRPNQRDACCPHYTLRLDSSQFKATKDQRQAINRFNKFVTGDAYAKEAARLYPLSRQEKRRRDNEFDLIERVHEAESKNVKTPPQPAHEFIVTLEPDTFTEEKYAIFENYQRLVHHEPPEKITRNGFKRFLCNSPIRRLTMPGEDGKVRKLGSYHQCYRLDGKLVAIGVLDLLPQCVSAVYFLYHESIHSHSPGKLGALREIALAIEGGYRWWYSGYYIHSCSKMRYKIDYSPQYVLDPETLTWDHLDQEALAVFNKKHYVSLSRDRRGLADDDLDNEIILPTASATNPTPDHADDDEDESEDFLLTSTMPGILSLEEMRHVDLNNIPGKSDHHHGFFLTQDLVVWPTQSIDEVGSIKSKIAELIAALGTDLMEDLCLDFRRRHRDPD
ncbi:arginine-tRNA-protein transferase [Coniochaeta sp. 2T2.1]|nr:arginine-tRNA-protein transferase [Coniochaeta sp. 2T2.1]